VEREQLLDALAQTGWNISRAAARLRLPRNTLRYRIEKHGLQRPGRFPSLPRREPAAAFPLAGAEPAPEPLPSAPAPPPVIPPMRGARRRLPVLRAALRAPAPEGDWAVESSRALDVLVEKLASFGGIVLELSPSGLVGAFGVTPMEDAPSRAALAALAILKAV